MLIYLNKTKNRNASDARIKSSCNANIYGSCCMLFRFIGKCRRECETTSTLFSPFRVVILGNVRIFLLTEISVPPPNLFCVLKPCTAVSLSDKGTMGLGPTFQYLYEYRMEHKKWSRWNSSKEAGTIWAKLFKLVLERTAGEWILLCNDIERKGVIKQNYRVCNVAF